MRKIVHILLAATLLGAGCLGDAGEPPAPAESDSQGTEADASDPPVGSPGPSSTDQASAHSRFAPPVNVSLDTPGAEPMLAVAPDGDIFLTGTGAGRVDGVGLGGTIPTQGVWRSTDDGTTWEDVTPTLPTARRTGVDNSLAVGADGTVYYANAAGGSLQLHRSSDGGESWEPSPVPPFPTPMHRTWLAPHEGSEVHLSVEGLPDTINWHHGSGDRGATWGAPTPINKVAGFGSDLSVGPNGTLYMARTSLTSALPSVPPSWSLYVSDDDGTTWEQRSMFERTSELTGSWQSLEVGPDGTLYMVWAQMANGTSLVHYAFSKDAEVWSKPRPLAPVEGSQTLPWMDVRGPGEIGVVWYATDEQGVPGETNARWHVEYAFVEDAATSEPVVHRFRVTSWAVHDGVICTDGPRCSYDERRLLDFTWIDFGPDGRAHLAFASTRWDRPSAFPVYAGELKAWPMG